MKTADNGFYRVKTRDKYDERMVSLGEEVFNLQMKLGSFVYELLGEFDKKECEISCPISFLDGMEYSILHAERIFIDPEEGIVKIAIHHMNRNPSWGELDISTQYFLSNELLARYASGNIMQSLEQREQCH